MDKPFRSIAKAASWRVTATATTLLIAWMVTHEINFAITIGFFEFFAKMGLYYFHERIWLRFKLGQTSQKSDYQI